MLRVRPGHDAVPGPGRARQGVRCSAAYTTANVGAAGDGVVADGTLRARPWRDGGERRVAARRRAAARVVARRRLSHRRVLSVAAGAARRTASAAASSATPAGVRGGSRDAPPTTPGAPATACSAAATPAPGARRRRCSTGWRRPTRRRSRAGGLPRAALPPPAPYDRMFAADGVAASAAARHDGTLRYVDLRLREVADALTASGRWERTLLVVTSTHGRRLDLDGDGDADLTPGGVHVPLLLRAPDLVPRGFVVEEIAQINDVAPTILSLTRVAAPDAPMQGRALLRDGAATPGPRFAFAEAFRREAGDARRKAVRGPRAQFVWRSDEANAFYDLARDGEGGPDRLAEALPEADLLRRALFDWLAASERWARAHDLGGARAIGGAEGARDASAE
ncbi:MAG: sulfatase-like hydrolase/transferase [Candidatus Binatia bacterium]